MVTINAYKREQLTKWAVGFSIVAQVAAVFLGPAVYMAVPPDIYLFLAGYLILVIPAIIFGILGLKGPMHKMAVFSLVWMGVISAAFTWLTVIGFRDLPGKQVLAEIETAVAPACAGQGNPAAGTYIPGAGIHPVAAQVNGDIVPVTDAWVPEAYWPTSLGEVELVACIGDLYSQTIETCSYNDGTTKKRVQFLRDVRLVVAKTGEIIATHTVTGGLPDECPDVIGSRNSSDIEGSKPHGDEISEWLEQVFTP